MEENMSCEQWQKKGGPVVGCRGAETLSADGFMSCVVHDPIRDRISWGDKFVPSEAPRCLNRHGEAGFTVFCARPFGHAGWHTSLEDRRGVAVGWP